MENTTQEQPIARVKGDFPMYTLMVRSKVKAAHVTEVEAAVKRVFAALPDSLLSNSSRILFDQLIRQFDRTAKAVYT